MNKKKSLKNIIFGLFSQIIILILGLIVPRLILTNYGSDTNGLISTITQIFTYMALLEAGIGQATTNSLYPYINEDKKDKNKISEVMSISRRYFRKVTYIYAIVVLSASFILPFILKTSVSYWTVFLYILFEGFIGVISFYYIQSWNSLLQVDGKNYVVTNIELITKLLCYGIKILLTSLGVNIVYIQIGYFFVSLIKLFIYRMYTKKYYSWVTYTNENKNEKLKDRNSYIISEIAWTIFSSTDMIILSFFCSTQLSSVYSIYNMVYVALNSLLNAIYNGVRFNLGQVFFEDLEKYKKLHDLFNTVFLGIMTILMSVTYILIIPFVKLYTNGVGDINYIYKYLPFLFCLVQMISWSRYIAGNITAVAGFAKKTSYISIIEMILNIILSLILVNYFGITGVLIATVLALPLKVIYCNWLADYRIMKRNCKKTAFILGGNWIIFLIVVLVGSNINLNVKSYYEFMLYGIILSFFIGTVTLILNCITNKELYYFIKRKLFKKNERMCKNDF